MRKFLAGLGAFAVAVALLLPLQVYATDQQSNGTTTLTTTVPDTHTVLLDIGEHGSVIINGTAYTGKDKSVEIARLKEQSYLIQPEKGWKVEKVCYGQKDVLETVKLTDNAFTAPAVNSDDNKLTVRFAEVSTGSGSNTDRPNSSGDTGVQTGDNTNIAGIGTLLFLSLTAIILLSKKKRVINTRRTKP